MFTDRQARREKAKELATRVAVSRCAKRRAGGRPQEGSRRGQRCRGRV